jgi:seryl-tRNA synthetase
LEGKSDCLIGTAEITVAGMFSGELLKREALPAKYVAFSHCFRKEAGRGESSKGLYRLHQFSKVEMFGFTEGNEGASEGMLAEMLDIQESLFSALGLHYKVLDMATEELGAAAYRKYDIEAWFPGRGDFGEISSASDCTSYQSKRLNISYLDQGNERRLVHTVNGTALAVPRIIMAILENYFDEERGTVEMPDVLKPFLPFERIGPDKRTNIVLSASGKKD